MTETEYLSNALNQYTNITAMAAPVYDLDGNTVSVNGWTYTWDAENRLIGASNAAAIADYKYDYMSRRYQKVVNGVTNSFQYEGWNLISEVGRDSLGAPFTNKYCWGQDLSGSLQGAGGVGGLLSMTRISGGISNTYFYCMDGNGNVTDMVDADGNNVAHYEYGPFGETLVATGPMALINHFRYSTKYWDDETGLGYWGFRYYSPELGRWLSRDPIGEDGGWHLYSFCRNRALRSIDYLGWFEAETPGIPSKKCSTDIYFGHSGDSWNPSGDEKWAKCQWVAYGVCWGDRVNNDPEILPKDHLIPGIPEQPGLIPLPDHDPHDYSNLTDDEIRTMAKYYSSFLCAGLKQMGACCDMKTPDGDKKDKDGKPIMKRCCTQCALRIFYDKDPLYDAIHVENIWIKIRSRWNSIPGLKKEIKDSCPGLSDKLKTMYGDGLPKTDNNPQVYSIMCPAK
jgi:RHS repeat-associated protein